jgi:DNA-binding transcriptional regulator YhcF (GntR family)
MMKLVRVTNSTFNEVDRNLRILEEAGFITQRRTKQKRVISLNAENKKTSTMLETLRVLEAANGV